MSVSAVALCSHHHIHIRTGAPADGLADDCLPLMLMLMLMLMLCCGLSIGALCDVTFWPWPGDGPLDCNDKLLEL